jgi:hypothetical protein
MDMLWHTDEVAEVSLLVPASQMSALAALAESRRVTVGEFLRGLINRSLTTREDGNEDRAKTSAAGR